ncbi:hypothetical protein M2323_001437 [Rhodoblastus acidophilus]|uniref:hypothetical protein n=1 Tax=Rhodoblastus acidophilus TaxID=1074 RepID=UPI002224100A|nr:hypothetical protein [Rhodoblastus acidophilus]MCW2283665.1 hypothetical protein [Rhodoblastus acidophilus]MCW2332525.1 hypothetical protein [Rhodoblastus acidophilus]
MDPIFSAIGAVRRARAAYDQVRAPMLAAHQEHPILRTCFTFEAKADGDSEKVSTLHHLNAWLDRQGPVCAVDCKRTFAEAAARVLSIPEPAVADPSPEALAAWEAKRAAIVVEFERAKQAYDEAQEEARAGIHYDAIDKAADALEAAETAALATIPTTAAGGVALLRFCLEAMERYDDHREVEPAMLNALAVLEDAHGAGVLT